MRCHIPVPHSDRGPIEIQCQVCVVLPKSRDESRCQRGGELQVLVCKQEWCYSGVQSNVCTYHTKDPEIIHVDLHKFSTIHTSLQASTYCLFIHPHTKNCISHEDFQCRAHSQHSASGSAMNHKAKWVWLKVHIVEDTLRVCKSTGWHCDKGNFISHGWGILQLLYEK